MTATAFCGFDGTTVEAIAAACDVSPATVYRYFPTKEDIVFTDIERQGDRLIELIDEQPDRLAPNQALYQALRGLAEEYLPNRASMRANSRLGDDSLSLRARRAEVQQRWEQSVVAALQRRPSTAKLGIDDALLRFMTATGLSSFRVATELWLADDANDLHELFDRAAVRLTEGFGG